MHVSVPEKMSKSMSFQELVKRLPENVSKNTAKSLTVPIVFVCLLHLANEKVNCFMFNMDSVSNVCH